MTDGIGVCCSEGGNANGEAITSISSGNVDKSTRSYDGTGTPVTRTKRLMMVT